MAKAPRKTTAAKAPAAAKATDTTKTAAQPAGTATVRFSKEKHGGRVRGAVNGQTFNYPVDADVQVTAAELEALTNSHVEFSTVTPLAGEDAAEGSAASSTITGTANRLFPAGQDDDAPKVDADGNPLEPHELRQITDKELTDGADQQTSKDSAEAAEKDSAPADKAG